MKTIIKNNVQSIFLMSLLLCSCDSFLEEVPDDRTQIDSIDKIAELLVAAYPDAGYTPFLEPRTDNAGDKGLLGVRNTINTEMYFWRDIKNVFVDTPTFYWHKAYRAISQVNQALVSIEEMGGGKELDYLKGEALLTRAYVHFMLVNIWGKTYNPATAPSDLGIPYVTEPESVVFKKYKRNSVKEVYDYIEADLLEGLPLVTNQYQVPKFHFNIDAANAFASRFYLFKGEWQKVIDYSSKVIRNKGNSTLRDLGGVYRQLTFEEIRERYTSVEEPANLLLVFGVSLFGREKSFQKARFQLSPYILLDLFFPDSNPINNKGWVYDYYGDENSYNFQKYNIYSKTNNASAGTGFAFTGFVLLSIEEVLLNRIEAYAMLNQNSKAVEDINTYLSVKTFNYDENTDRLSLDDIASFYEIDSDIYTPFYEISLSQLPLIHCAAEFKRREYYNEGLRWFDNRRYNMQIVHTDFLGNEFILNKDDNRKQLQIPQSAIEEGLQPNP